MSRIEKKSSEPSFTVATTSHELRGDYSKAAADFTIRQDWSQYGEAEHALWRKLYARQAALMPKYAAKAVQQSLDDLDFSGAIPDLEKVSGKLHAATGWYPLLPVFRRLGFRSAREIAGERYALKALRGDFHAMNESAHAGSASSIRRGDESVRGVQEA